MILAQNHQRLSNGNNILALAFILIISLSSCELFKTAQNGEDIADNNKEELDAVTGKKVYNPETGRWETVEEFPVEKIDTVVWKDVPPSSYPPIVSDGSNKIDVNSTEVIGVDDIGSEKLSSYNVAMMLPFLSQRFSATDTEIYDNSLWAIQYYAGAKMALDKLEEEGIKLNVSVLDTEASPYRTDDLLRTSSDLLNAHLIIGPYRKENLAKVANFAKQNNISFVSPHSASANITQKNPNYIQVSPTLRTHCESIMAHALDNFSVENIVLVSRENEKEKARLAFFYDQYSADTEGKGLPEDLEELTIPDKTYSFADLDLKPYLEGRDTTVFIVPSWSENYIYALLHKIEDTRTENNHVVVYGMPQWINFEKVEYEYYEKLNVRVTSGTFINRLSSEAQSFKRSFFERYGVVPNSEAYLGYDVMLYFGRMINKYGTKFQYYLDKEPIQEALLTEFWFNRRLSPSPINEEQMSIERFENSYVNLLEFKDYYFQKVQHNINE